MTSDNKQSRSWVDIIPIVLAFIGAMLSITAATAFYTSQADVASGSMWPLPGMVLLEWALLGAGGFVEVYLYLYKGASHALSRLWAIIGALVPLIIVGAFSIGTLVLIVFLIFLACAIILMIRRRASGFINLGMFFLGGVINALLLYLVIFASNLG